MNKPVWGAAFAECGETVIASCPKEEQLMPRGDKGAYTDKQKRKVEHIEESYEERGVCPISFSLSTVEYAQGATN